MFGHKKRKNINTIRKEIVKIRNLEEEKAGKKPNQMSPGGFVVVLVFMVIIVWSQLGADSDSELPATATPVGSTEIVHAAKVEQVQNPDTRISDNFNRMSRTEMSGSQIHSLSQVLNENNWTLQSISRMDDWAKGARYQISVNKGFYYLVYFNRDSIQSINNMSNQVVYGSRAEY